MPPEQLKTDFTTPTSKVYFLKIKKLKKGNRINVKQKAKNKTAEEHEISRFLININSNFHHYKAWFLEADQNTISCFPTYTVLKENKTSQKKKKRIPKCALDNNMETKIQ